MSAMDLKYPASLDGLAWMPSTWTPALWRFSTYGR